MNLSDLNLLDRVEILFGEGREAELIAKIGAGSIPRKEDILEWLGESASRGEYQPLKVDRYIFRRGNGSYVKIPDTPKCAALVRPL